MKSRPQKVSSHFTIALGSSFRASPGKANKRTTSDTRVTQCSSCLWAPKSKASTQILASHTFRSSYERLRRQSETQRRPQCGKPPQGVSGFPNWSNLSALMSTLCLFMTFVTKFRVWLSTKLETNTSHVRNSPKGVKASLEVCLQQLTIWTGTSRTAGSLRQLGARPHLLEVSWPVLGF